ncbi:esterase FE4 [Diachasma alloeum]|uniref:esterase FE4 n=1 Tax=Diachasma alloeum TaxID=454923 RepID=UPI0007384EBD|nr:esterase FE4 [Diachasma alloeum]
MRIFPTIPLVAVISLWISIVCAAHNNRVTISNGILEGSLLQSRKGRVINAFRGIPYARPPLGRLRFQPPQPATSWRGVRLATTERAQCLQKIDISSDMTTAGSEDCLYINVYTPNLPNPAGRNASQRYAVMVWFHGGSWTGGNSSLYGPEYLLDHDIVLVTMNYRLGPLGFLSTADRIIPGNYGLKDHVQALHWVRRNIAAFGGDPKKVTIMGESAGATGVHYLMLSRQAKGLFHQAISQSGTALNPSAFNTIKIARENAHRLARNLSCPTDTSERLLQCLQIRDPREITAMSGTWPMSSDALFNVGSATSVKEHLRKRSPIYYYYFAYSGDMKNPLIRGNPENDFGVGHAEDLMYLFPMNRILFPNSTMSVRDFQMVDAMTTLWTNFARFRKPVPMRTSQLPVIWEPVRTNSLENFVIRSPTRFEMAKDMFRDMLSLWLNFPCRAGLSRSSSSLSA